MKKRIFCALIFVIVTIVAVAENAWQPKPKYSIERLRFAWGAEVGSTIDMSGHDMSSIDVNLSVGASYSWLSFAGIGAGANIVVSNSCRTYPIYVDLRTDFSKFVKFVFLDFRGGVALNYSENNMNQTGLYLSPSLGFNLASGTTFRSYITLGYTYIARHDVNNGDDIIPLRPLSMASLRLGIAF